jgi:predicted amino acid-binding ACT domain protein
MAGRLILAILIDCDPAHVPAIEDELQLEFGKLDLDVAIEVI